VLNRYCQDRFDNTYQATIGLDFHSKNVVINNKNIRLNFYDTAGQEKFKSLIPMYIRDANVIIIVYDISNEESYNNITNWMNDVKDLKRSDAIFALAGNKSDLGELRYF